MRQNMGMTDRIVRAVAGVLLLVLYFTNVIAGTWGIIALVVAAVLLITAALGFCPLYVPFKISTRRL